MGGFFERREIWRGVDRSHLIVAGACVLGLIGVLPLAAAETGPARDLYGDPLPSGAIARMGSIRFPHAAQVECVRFSPDGKTVAVANWDSTVRIWEVASGKPRQTLSGHTHIVNVIAFSPEGRTLAAADRDQIRLWDVAKGVVLRKLELPDRKVFYDIVTIEFSPDGKVLAGNYHDRVGLWDAATGKLIRSFGGFVTSVAFSPDGKLLATTQNASYDSGVESAIVFWNVSTGDVARKLPSGGPLRQIVFSPDGKLLAGGRQDGTVRVWAADTAKLTREWRAHEHDVDSLAFSSDSKTLATVDAKLVRLWHADTGKSVRELTGHREIVRSVAFSPDGKLLASGSWDQRTLLWDLATGKPVVQPALDKSHGKWVGALAFSPDGKRLFSGSWDGTARLWETASGAQVRVFLPHGERSDQPVSGVAYAPDGKSIVAASWERMLRVWDAATGKERFTVNDARADRTVVFSPDGKSLATCGERSIVLRRADTGRELKSLEGHEGFVEAACFSPDGKLLASASDRSGRLAGSAGTIYLWDAATGGKVKELGQKSLFGRTFVAKAIAFSPDGTHLAAGGAGELRVWIVASGKQVAKIKMDSLWAIAWSPDGKRIAVDAPDAIALWDPVVAKQVGRCSCPQGSVMSLAYSADGKLLASGGSDGTILLWDVEKAFGKPVKKAAD